MSRAPSPDMEAVGLFSPLASPVQAEDTSAGVSEPVGSPDAPSGADQFDSIFGTPTFSSRQVSPACCLASPSHSKRSNSATQQAPPTASPSHSKRSSSATPNSPPTTLPSHRSPSTTGSTPKTPSGPVERLDIQRKYPTLEEIIVEIVVPVEEPDPSDDDWIATPPLSPTPLKASAKRRKVTAVPKSESEDTKSKTRVKNKVKDKARPREAFSDRGSNSQEGADDDDDEDTNDEDGNDDQKTDADERSEVHDRYPKSTIKSRNDRKKRKTVPLEAAAKTKVAKVAKPFTRGEDLHIIGFFERADNQVAIRRLLPNRHKASIRSRTTKLLNMWKRCI